MSKHEAYGIAFASGIERDRYLILLDLQRAGEISRLQAQPRLTLAPAATDPTGYRWPQVTHSPDFGYMLDGIMVYEEVKPRGKGAPSVTRRDWKVRQAWAARVYPLCVFRTVVM